MRKLMLSVLLVALIFALAAPALATVSKSGTQHCQAGWTPWVQSYSTGFTEHWPPGTGGYEYYYNFLEWRTRTTYNPGSGGPWVVQTDGALSSPDTYSGCSPFN